MRKLIVGMAALGVLAGGGAGAYFYLKQPAAAALPEQAKVEEHAEGSAASGGGGHGEEAKGSAPTYVQIEPLVVPIMDAEGISQTISMVITIEVDDEANAQKIRDLKPRIKDAMIQNLYGLLNQQAALDKGVVRVGYVKKRLNDVTAKVMGDGVVKDVLLQMVQQNPT